MPTPPNSNPTTEGGRGDAAPLASLNPTLMLPSDLAYIHPDAKIGKNVTIEPFAVIHGDVVIGDNCHISSGAVLMDGLRMGHNCRVYPGAVLSAVPQDLKYKGEYTQLTIGNNVTVREYCTLNKGTSANYATSIGNNVLLMAYVHVAHDCIIGSNCILANNVTLAGHIEVGDNAVLGGMTAVHQFVKIGAHAMVGGGSLVRKDVPPYVKAAREPLSYIGVNSIGLKRRGFMKQTIGTIQDVYRILFQQGYNVRQALQVIRRDVPPSFERDNVLDFIANSQRGLMRGYS